VVGGRGAAVGAAVGAEGLVAREGAARGRGRADLVFDGAAERQDLAGDLVAGEGAAGEAHRPLERQYGAAGREERRGRRVAGERGATDGKGGADLAVDGAPYGDVGQAPDCLVGG